MIVSRKIAEMFKHCGFVNVDYLVQNKIYAEPSKILNILNRDWRKWVKPVCMFDGGKPLDPNFGYETIGTSSYYGANYIRGSVFTCPESGTADSISWYNKYAFSGVVKAVKCAIYKHSDLSFVGVTEELIAGAANTWITHNFTVPKPDLINTQYILVWWSRGSYAEIAYDTGETDQGHYQYLYYNSFPDPLDPAHENCKYSIYCTYTVAGGVANYQTVSDSLGLLDSVAPKGIFKQSISDLLGLLDSTSSIKAQKQTVTEILGLLDTIITKTGYHVTVSDILGLVDSAVGRGDFKQSVVDIVGLLETIVPKGYYKQTISDILGFLDSVGFPTHYTVTISDVIGILDSISKTRQFWFQGVLYELTPDSGHKFRIVRVKDKD